MLLSSTACEASGPCATSDFEVVDLKVQIKSKCDNNRCPRVVFAGNLLNNCATAASAKIRITIYDERRTPVEILEDWTTAPQNLAPGGLFPFVRKSDIYTPEMSQYIVEIVDTKTW